MKVLVAEDDRNTRDALVEILAAILEDDTKWSPWEKSFKSDDTKYVSELTLLQSPGRRPMIARDACLRMVETWLREVTGRLWTREVFELIDVAFETNIAPESLKRARQRLRA